MNVGSLCTREVVAVRREITIAEAAALMRLHHIGDLLVLDEVDGHPTPIGIVTDRDIVVGVVAACLDPAALTVGDVMQSPLVTLGEAETCDDAIRLMALHGVRRMPVVDGDAHLVGVITLDDLLPYFAVPLARLSQLTARGKMREVGTRV